MPHPHTVERKPVASTVGEKKAARWVIQELFGSIVLPKTRDAPIRGHPKIASRCARRESMAIARANHEEDRRSFGEIPGRDVGVGSVTAEHPHLLPSR